MSRSTLRPGLDVPWVTSWTAESVVGVRPCVTVGGLPALCQAEQPGWGRPQYSKNHLLRQRLSVRRMLCPMCGEATTPENRWTQVAVPVAAGVLRRQNRAPGLPAEIEDDRLLLDAGSIAPLHRRCSEVSLNRCPHLSADPAVRVIRFPERWVVIPLLIEATSPEGGGALPVVTFLQICGVSTRRDPRGVVAPSD